MPGCAGPRGRVRHHQLWSCLLHIPLEGDAGHVGHWPGVQITYGQGSRRSEPAWLRGLLSEFRRWSLRETGERYRGPPVSSGLLRSWVLASPYLMERIFAPGDADHVGEGSGHLGLQSIARPRGDVRSDDHVVQSQEWIVR